MSGRTRGTGACQAPLYVRLVEPVDDTAGEPLPEGYAEMVIQGVPSNLHRDADYVTHRLMQAVQHALAERGMELYPGPEVAMRRIIFGAVAEAFDMRLLEGPLDPEDDVSDGVDPTLDNSDDNMRFRAALAEDEE